MDHCLRKRKTRLGEQTWQCVRDKTVSRWQFIREIHVDQDDPFWMWYIVRPVVWQLIVELDQCTVCQQNSRHHLHPNRNTRADHQTPREDTNYRRTARIHNCCLCHAAGRNRQILPVYGVGTRLRNVASREVMSGTRLCIPGTNISTPTQPLISVETGHKPALLAASGLRVTKTDPVSWSQWRQTPVLMRLIFPVIAACLFGCSPRRPGELLRGEMQLLKRILTVPWG